MDTLKPNKITELAEHYVNNRILQDTDTTRLWKELMRQAFVAGAAAQQELDRKKVCNKNV